MCAACDDTGIVPYVRTDNPKSDSAIGVEDLHFALCLCAKGQTLRQPPNDRSAYPVWQAWAAQQQIDHGRVCKVEEIFSADELARHGLTVRPAGANRDSALLGLTKKAGKL